MLVSPRRDAARREDPAAETTAAMLPTITLLPPLLLAWAAPLSAPPGVALSPLPPPARTGAIHAGVLGRRALLTTTAGALVGGGGGRASAVEAPPLTASQLLSAAEYVRDLREARRALSGLRPLLERADASGYEATRIELRKPPVNTIRKACSKLVALLDEGEYKRRRSAQYEAIKAALGALDDGCRPDAKRDGLDLPGLLGALERGIDEFTEGYGIEQ